MFSVGNILFLLLFTSATLLKISGQDVTQELSLINNDAENEKQLERIFSGLGYDEKMQYISAALHNTKDVATICWNELTTIDFYSNGTTYAFADYSISLELTSPKIAAIDDQYDEIETYSVQEDGSHKAKILEFATVAVDEEKIVKQNKTSCCRSDKTYISILQNADNRKRVEINIGPVKENLGFNTAPSRDPMVGTSRGLETSGTLPAAELPIATSSHTLNKTKLINNNETTDLKNIETEMETIENELEDLINEEITEKNEVLSVPSEPPHLVTESSENLLQESSKTPETCSEKMIAMVTINFYVKGDLHKSLRHELLELDLSAPPEKNQTFNEELANLIRKKYDELLHTCINKEVPTTNLPNHNTEPKEDVRERYGYGISNIFKNLKSNSWWRK